MADPLRPLASVAVITYNQEAYIAACLDSAIAQTYRPIEIVVADDGSTDGTRAIILDYAQRYPGLIVPVFAERNGGVTANSTAAHRACTGDFIAWLGGDDIMSPTKIERQVNRMTAEPDIAVCYHDLDVFDSDSGATIRRFSDGNPAREGGIDVAIRYGTFNGGSATMVRRSAAPDGFDARIPVASDWLYWIECLSGGGRIVYIDQILGRYRRHAGNVTTGHDPRHRLLLDHLLTCMIVLVRMPHHASAASWAMARLLRVAARRMQGRVLGLHILAYVIAGTSAILRAVEALTRRQADP